MKRLSNYKTGVLTFIVIYSCLTLFSGCCKCDDPTDPECPNYDPCYEVYEPEAALGAGYILDIPGHSGLNLFFQDTIIYLDGDTIPGTCTFYSYTANADSFYWKVGQDPRVFRGESFYLEFDDQFHLTPIPVELVVMKKNDCFDGGFINDTINKNYVVSSKPFDSPSIKYFNSKYLGISTEFPNDSFEIEFMDDIAWINNFPKGTNGNTNLWDRDFDEVYFWGQSEATIWEGHAKFQPENRRKVVINYRISYDLGETSSNWYEYVGYRVD